MIAAAIALLLVTVPVFQSLGSEFMPPLYEGTLLYMPNTLPGVSITEAGRLLQVQARLIRQIPEVESVFLTPAAEYLPEGEEPKTFAVMSAPPGYNLETMAAALQPQPIAMVSACLPCAPARRNSQSRLNATRGR